MDGLLAHVADEPERPGAGQDAGGEGGAGDAPASRGASGDGGTESGRGDVGALGVVGAGVVVHDSSVPMVDKPLPRST